MLIASLMLAGTDRCAVAVPCLSDQQIILALHSEEADISAALNRDTKKIDDVVMIKFERILGVTDVYCDDGEAKTDTVQCKFTVRYPSHSDYRIAKFTRSDSRWQIVDGQTVTRKRRTVR